MNATTVANLQSGGDELLRRASRHAPRGISSPLGFTLLELAVTMTILAVLGALSLAGLQRVSSRMRADKTRSTVRKLSDVIIPRYNRIIKRRLPSTDTTTGIIGIAKGADLLWRKRLLWLFEMPDHYNDRVFEMMGGAPHLSSGALVTAKEYPELFLGPSVNYSLLGGFFGGTSATVAARRTNITDLLPNDHPDRTNGPITYLCLGGSENLFFNLLLYPDDEHPLNLFREDEYCDADGDGRPEFADGWGRPIYFLRWAPGHSNQPTNTLTPLSMIQFADPRSHHDAMDRSGIDKNGFMLWPLIVSAGGDSELGIRIPKNSTLFSAPGTPVKLEDGTSQCLGGSEDGLASNLTTHCKDENGVLFGGLLNVTQAVDNISNHVLKQ